MNLVQKLPIGLSLACLMFMSSCSKEDAQTPEPKAEGVNTHSGLKEGPVPVIITAGYLPSTKGPTGFNVYPLNWFRSNYPFYSSDLQKLPTGTSSFTHLWGNSSKPWLKTLPAIPSAQNSASIVTVTTNSNSWDAEGKLTAVESKIKYLIPGKKYQFTIYLASTVPASEELGQNSLYAKEAKISMSFQNPVNGNGGLHNHYIDLTGSQANWIAKTIIFQAGNTDMDFRFSALAPQPGKYSYAHIYIDENSIKKVN